MARVPRKSAFARLIEHFHTHPRGRLHEILFWSGIGLALGAGSLLAWWTDKLSTPLALMAAVIAACFVGWAFLPQRREAPPPPKPGRLRQQRR